MGRPPAVVVSGHRQRWLARRGEHDPDVGLCSRCGITIVRTAVAGDVYVREGCVVAAPTSCRYGEPCSIAMPTDGVVPMVDRCKRCDVDTEHRSETRTHHGAIGPCVYTEWTCSVCDATKLHLTKNATPFDGGNNGV